MAGFRGLLYTLAKLIGITTPSKRARSANERAARWQERPLCSTINPTYRIVTATRHIFTDLKDTMRFHIATKHTPENCGFANSPSPELG